MTAPTFTKVRDIARSQIGIFEDPFGSNQTKYGAWYGWNGVAWCDIFQSWCFDQAGGLDLLGGKAASVYVTANRFRAMGRFGITPRVGALAIFSGYSHIELVTSVGNGIITSIGGNTSAGAGSISNGGCVAEKKRSTTLIMGYCYPAYAPPPAVRPPAPATPLVTPVNLIVDGQLGPKTYAAINRWTGRGNTGVWDLAARQKLQAKVHSAQDGQIGPRTTALLQRLIGASVDGVWGRGTTIALQRYLNAR